MNSEWKGHVNGILYGIQFDPVLGEAVVARVADGVANGLYPGDRAVTIAAIDEALKQQGPLNDVIEAPYSEDAIREFLGRLAAELRGRTR